VPSACRIETYGVPLSRDGIVPGNLASAPGAKEGLSLVAELVVTLDSVSITEDEEHVLAVAVEGRAGRETLFSRESALTRT